MGLYAVSRFEDELEGSLIDLMDRVKTALFSDFPDSGYGFQDEKRVLRRLDNLLKFKVPSKGMVGPVVFEAVARRKIRQIEPVGVLMESMLIEARKRVIEGVLPVMHKKLGGRSVMDSLGNQYGEELYDATFSTQLASPIGLDVSDELLRFSRTNIEAAQFLVNKKFSIKSSDMTENMSRRLSRDLMIGYSKGESLGELTARVDKIVEKNAKVIAVTEINGAANYGEYAFAKEYRERFETDIRKVWRQLPRETKRGDHAAVSGQRRNLEEVYIVGGEDCFYPHDESLSVGQVVRCSCRLDYESIKGVAFHGIPVSENEFARRILVGSKGEVVAPVDFSPSPFEKSITKERLSKIVGMPEGLEFNGNAFAQDNALNIMGSLLQGGKTRGYLHQQVMKVKDFNQSLLSGLNLAEDGIIAYNVEMKLMPQLQGKGIMKGHFKAIVPFYESLGVSGVVINASGDVGRYAWSRYGFDFMPWEKPGILNSWKMYLKNNGVFIEDAVFEKLFVHSWDIASFQSGSVLLGKRFLMSEPSWWGYLNLSRGTESRLILSNYIGELDG